MVSINSEGKLSIDFDSEIFSIKAVESTIYDLDSSADISITGYNKRMIRVVILSFDDNKFSIEMEMRKAVLDHQIRIDIEKESGPLRKLILAQAFFPCENIEQLIDEIDYE